MIASGHEHAHARGGLAPAFAAARSRLGLVVSLYVLAGIGWWWTIDQMRGMDGGPWTGLGTFAWFVGQVMKRTGGRADPLSVREALTRALA